MSPASYDNVKQKWIPEISHHSKGVPIILVGTKTDLRENKAYVEEMAQKNLKPITTEQGEKLKEDIKAQKYIECSAKTQTNVKFVFDEAIRVCLFYKPPKRKVTCDLL